MTIKGTIRGKTIELPTALPYPDGQEVTIEVLSTNGTAIGSPAALLAALRSTPPIDPSIVDEWERVIQIGLTQKTTGFRAGQHSAEPMR